MVNPRISADGVESQKLIKRTAVEGESSEGSCQRNVWGRRIAVGSLLVLAAADVITPLALIAMNPGNLTMYRIGVGWTLGNIVVFGCAIAACYACSKSVEPRSGPSFDRQFSTTYSSEYVSGATGGWGGGL